VLVIKRKAGESVVIGNQIRITVLETHGGAVRLGIEAPPQLSVYRSELVQDVERANRAAAEGETNPAAVEKLGSRRAPSPASEKRPPPRRREEI
jgi:carbon storage regulator